MWHLSSLKTIVIPVAILTACQGDGASTGLGDEPVSISVSPSLGTVSGGKMLRLTARTRGEDGSYSELFDATWTTTDGEIASVDATGGVRGLRAGQVQIVATWHQSRATSLVTVVDSAARKPSGRCPALLMDQDVTQPVGPCKAS